MDNILEYSKLVSKIASKYSSFSNYEDLYQVGMIGLMKALDKYENNSDTKFSTYAYIWIKGEILEYLRCDKNIKYSKEILSLSKEITITQEILRNKLNHEPSIKELAFYLEKDEKDIEEALLSREIVLSCDYSLNEQDESKNVNLYDCVPFYQKEYDADYIDLHNAIDNLSEDEKKIINMRYFEDMTQTEVSKILNTHQVNISRREEKILSKLNKSLVA